MEKDIRKKINYMICRAKDIDFDSQPWVFQRKFTRSKTCNNWLNPDVEEFENLEQFQIERLGQINNCASQIEKFLWELYEKPELLEATNAKE